MSRADDLGGFLKAVVALSRGERVTLTAASLAYYAFNSLVPFVLLSVIGVSVLGDPEAVTGAIRGLLDGSSSQVTALVRQPMTATRGRIGAGVIAGAILLWSAVRLFSAVDNAFQTVYGTRRESGPVEDLLDTAIVLATFVAALAPLGGVGVALSVLLKGRAWVVFSPLSLVDGGPILFLSWLYVSMLVLVVGVVINAVRSATPTRSGCPRSICNPPVNVAIW